MDIKSRVSSLRSLMKERSIDAFIIPSSDNHGSEYVSDYFRVRQWISGFTGSAGIVVITDKEAHLWVDGRYFLQGEQQIQGTEYILERMGEPGVKTYTQWICDNVQPGGTVSFNGKVFTVSEFHDLERAFREKGIKINPEEDIFNKLWRDRPAMPNKKVFIHEDSYAGKTVEEKLALVKEEMNKIYANNLLLASLDDIAWLLNLRGGDVECNPVFLSYLLISDGQCNLYIDKEKLNDNIVFVFQPAEEDTGGAKRLMDAGVFKKYKVDEVYGLHIHPDFPEGYIACRPGYLMAQNGELNIDIIGKGGHGAIPQNTKDAILIASEFITSLQSIISRNINPIEGAVITIGRITGGSVRNIIAEDVRLEGTIRCFNPSVYDTMVNRIRAFVKGFEVSYGCKINAEIVHGYLAVNNDKKLYAEFVNAIGKDMIIETDPLMISEDFSYYQREVPGLFFMLGARNEEKGFVNGLHNFNFNFNEDILMDGLNIYKLLLEYKNSLRS